MSVVRFQDYVSCKLPTVPLNDSKYVLKHEWHTLAQIQLSNEVNFIIAKKLGNGFIPMSMLDLRKKDYCEILNNTLMQKSYFEDLFNHSDLPNNCNHLPGNYTFFDYIPQIPNNMPAGEFRGELEYFWNDIPGLKFKGYVVLQ